MNVRVELVAREVPAEAAGSSPNMSGTCSNTHITSNVRGNHIASNVKMYRAKPQLEVVELARWRSSTMEIVTRNDRSDFRLLQQAFLLPPLAFVASPCFRSEDRNHDGMG